LKNYLTINNIVKYYHVTLYLLVLRKSENKKCDLNNSESEPMILYLDSLLLMDENDGILVRKLLFYSFSYLMNEIKEKKPEIYNIMLTHNIAMDQNLVGFIQPMV
jgi:hypothetical protein